MTALDMDENGLKELAGLSGTERGRTVVGDASDERVVNDLVSGQLLAFGDRHAISAKAGVAGSMRPTDGRSLKDFGGAVRIETSRALLCSHPRLPRSWSDRPHLVGRGRPRRPQTRSRRTRRARRGGEPHELTPELAAEGITVKTNLPAVAIAIAGFNEDQEAVAGLVKHVPAGRALGFVFWIRCGARSRGWRR